MSLFFVMLWKKSKMRGKKKSMDRLSFLFSSAVAPGFLLTFKVNTVHSQHLNADALSAWKSTYYQNVSRSFFWPWVIIKESMPKCEANVSRWFAPFVSKRWGKTPPRLRVQVAPVPRNSRLLKHSGGVICRGVEFSLLKALYPDEETIDLFISLFKGQWINGFLITSDFLTLWLKKIL